MKLEWMAVMFLAAGCGGGMSTNTGMDGGGTADADMATLASGTGSSMAAAALPSDPVNFKGDAVATFKTTATTSILSVLIYEGTSTCAATHWTVGKHSVSVGVIRGGNNPAAITAGTYASTDSGDPMHPTSAGGGVSDVTLNSNSGSCQTTQVAINGGDLPYTLNITELDATHVAGTFNITIAHGHEAGVPLTGSFNAPICQTLAPGSCM